MKNHMLTVNNSHEKCITEGQEQQNVCRVQTICNLNLCYSLALPLHEKCTRF